MMASRGHDMTSRSTLCYMVAEDVRLELVRGRQLLISGQQTAPRKADGGERELTVFNGGFFGPLSFGGQSTIQAYALASAHIWKRVPAH